MQKVNQEYLVVIMDETLSFSYVALGEVHRLATGFMRQPCSGRIVAVQEYYSHPLTYRYV